MKIVFIQTADAFIYEPMLRATSKTVIEYCRRHNCEYECFIGVKRGFWPWQATYNRIIQYKELMERGFDGWVIYLDADAYIVDQSFDIRSYLAKYSNMAAILTPSMSTDHDWDVNAGVCLINLGDADGRALVTEWYRHFQSLSMKDLQDADVWLECGNDQDFLQIILRENQPIMSRVYLQSTDLINSSFASFIRQQLRVFHADFKNRIDMINKDVNKLINRNEDDDENNSLIFDERNRFIEETAVIAIYEGLLGRKPEPEALKNCLHGIDRSGVSYGLLTLAKEVAASAEFREKVSRS